jgi:membrane protease YdiL (CAAX protease family)
MFTAIFLSLLVPFVIYMGLIVLHDITLTFVMFYLGVCLLVPLIDLIIVQKLSWPKIGNSFSLKGFRKNILPGIIIGLIFFASIYLFFIAFSNKIIDTRHITRLLAKWNVSDSNLFIFLFIMIFANSFLEELYWRGYIFNKLQKKIRLWGVILFTALFYSSYHLVTTVNLFSLEYGLLFTLVVFGAGVFWGYIRGKSDSVYIPIISHLLADLGIMVIYLKFIR